MHITYHHGNSSSSTCVPIEPYPLYTAPGHSTSIPIAFKCQSPNPCMFPTGKIIGIPMSFLCRYAFYGCSAMADSNSAVNESVYRVFLSIFRWPENEYVGSPIRVKLRYIVQMRRVHSQPHHVNLSLWNTKWKRHTEYKSYDVITNSAMLWISSIYKEWH